MIALLVALAAPLAAVAQDRDPAGPDGAAQDAAGPDGAAQDAAGQGLAGQGHGKAVIAAARYVGPTDRYPHRVLGDLVEHEALEVTLADGSRRIATLGPEAVFEDVAPRLADLDGDGRPEVVTVESHLARGARLAVWGLGPQGFARRAATPYIGTRFRWLAVAGAADLDGDGAVEIAYVDRPHLARVLRVWRYSDGALTELAAAPGHTNHRIGEAEIAGGIRTCAGAPEVVTASADWSLVLGTRLVAGALVTRVLRPHAGRGSFAAAMRCD